MIETSEQLNELATALAAAQGEMVTVGRDREVTVKTKTGGSYKFRYATFDGIVEMVRPILAKHGLSFAQFPSAAPNGGLYLVTALLHSSGQWVRSAMPVKVSGDGAQEVGSALTYTKRYALSAVLGVSSDEDDDGNTAAGNEITSSIRAPRPAVSKPEEASVSPDDWPLIDHEYSARGLFDAPQEWAEELAKLLPGIKTEQDYRYLLKANEHVLLKLPKAQQDYLAAPFAGLRERLGIRKKEAARAAEPQLVP